MRKIGKIFAIIFFFLGILQAEAQQGVVVQATTDREKMEVGDTFTVTVMVQSTESVQVEEPHLPRLSGVELMQQWENTSVQQSLTSTPNGMDWQTTRRNQFHFMFQAKTVGRFSVDSFEVVVNGKIFRTQPVMIEVLPSGQGSQQGVPQPRGRTGGIPNFPGFDEDEMDLLREQEEIFNQLLQRRLNPGQPQGQGGTGGGARQQAEPEYRSMPTNPNEAFFIQLEVDKKNVYEGEQVTASWYLLTRGQMETLDRVKFPSLKGFWKEIIEENPQIQFVEEVINGVVYRKALLASHALFPIKSGAAIIDEFTVKSRVRMPSQGMGFGFGFGRAYNYTKSSRRLELGVKPLPTQDRPSQFTGAVGNFNVNAQIEGQQFSANQPFTMKVRFEGQGNAKAIDLPRIEWPEGLELYDTKNESRFFKDGTSFKEFEILLIPRKTGVMEIPPIQFAFFNPKTEKYEQKETGGIRLDVTGVASPNHAEGKNFLGKASEVKRVLSLPPVMEVPMAKGSSSQISLATVWGPLYILSLLGLLGFGWKELRPQNRSISLRKKLDLHWKKVEKSLADKSARQLGAEIVNAFNLVLSEISSHRGEILEIHKMVEKLNPTLREKYAVNILENYENAQLLSFAPDAVVEQAGHQERLVELAKKSHAILKTLCSES